MSYLLDTNTCIRYLNGQSANVKARLERLTPDEIVLCSSPRSEFRDWCEIIQKLLDSAGRR